MVKKKIKIALIFGGTSAERRVSLISAQNVFENLDRGKYFVEKIEITKDRGWIARNLNKIRKSDVAFLALHGPGGEDGTVQGLLDLLGIPYTFSGTLTSALGMNKSITKRLVASSGTLVPTETFIKKSNYQKNPKKYLSQIHGRVVIKPNQIGSSFGVAITSDPIQIKKSIQNAFKHGTEIIIEPYIAGKEFTVPILGNDQAQPLPVIAIVPRNGSEFFDFNAKYYTQYRDEIVPAPISADLTKRLQETALKVHKLLGCRGISRSDFIVTSKEQIYFLEINTIPGLTSTSLVPQSAEATGLSYQKFLDKLINLALEA